MSDYRHEYKYYLNAMQDAVVRMKVMGGLQRDSHVGENGQYRIQSLYFDDPWDTCFLENQNGTDPRSKFRIRYYNDATDFIRLEKKSKVKGMTRKESAKLSEEECRSLMRGIIPVVGPDMPQEKQRLFMEMQVRSLLPKVIVSYVREPYIYEPGNVRVTFDRHITSSNCIQDFLKQNRTERLVMPMGMNLLEVKWDEALPVVVKEILGLDSLRWTSFSKYGMCRKYHL